MASGILSIDLDAIAANWRALDQASSPQTQTGAVVKADAYGLGADRVARTLARAGARRFFVALTEEGARVRQALGPGPQVCVLGGHMEGDTRLIAEAELTPMLNSLDQLTRHFEALPGHPFGIQLDTGMNRLGLEPGEWAAVASLAVSQGPDFVMSHLACADEPDHPMNRAQLDSFRRMTDGTGLPRSLAATGGILLGPDYHFELTRPGIGLYGGLPFAEASQTVRLSLPVVQIRAVEPEEIVGYSATWQAAEPTLIATVAAGYADGLSRRLSGQGTLWAGDVPCPLIGRVSMDLITADVSHLDEMPGYLDILGPSQTPDQLADVIGTIGYEVLTSLGPRYSRTYRETR
ncbi:alanine racemase [Haematobacter massiliensis]|uniref:alanine racemase n=1 Tax=Haematobacter massiliensis TaxID=195105 RepID=UPI000B4A2E23|nr:alanine racemase [Haematobacter massiliensis]OWJ69755.1 alanine racemase [Haematobacter massiliensis]